MIHSASFLASGSEIAASAWVASAGLCLRTRSMTFSSACLSSLEVEDVVAIAAGVGGLRATAGGNAACWRVAGAIAGATGVTVAAGLDAVLSAVFSVVLGTTLRAIGRGLGNGIF